MVSPRQFDVFRNPSAREPAKPYVLVLQHDLFEDLKTRLVAPLVLSERIIPAPRLHPLFEIEGRKVYLNPTDVAGLPAQLLRDAITNVATSRDEIIAALDLVFTGI